MASAKGIASHTYSVYKGLPSEEKFVVLGEISTSCLVNVIIAVILWLFGVAFRGAGDIGEQIERLIHIMSEDTLAHVDLFSTLDKKELQVLAGSCQERSYGAGSTIFAQGDAGVGLYVLKSGKIRLTQINNPDRAEIEIGVMEAGEVMGEMTLLDDLPRSATAVAAEDVNVLMLPVWDFRAALRQHPDMALKLLAALSRRLRKVEMRRREW